MAARAPLDVDLEDKLVFGLSPLRFGYMVIAGLTAMALWGQRCAPMPLRLLVCLPVLGLGAAFAWARWRGRGLDQWVLDLGTYALTNYVVEFGPGPAGLLSRRRRAGRRGEIQMGEITAAIAGIGSPAWHDHAL